MKYNNMCVKLEFISKCLKMNQEFTCKNEMSNKELELLWQKKNTGNKMAGIPYEVRLNETYSNTTYYVGNNAG